MNVKNKKTVITEYLLEQLLKERYPLPEWIFIPQVSNGTGGYHRRTADAIALNCYPSRGMELHGFEIKVTKQDWLSELRNPKKSVAVQRYCDRWWLVISKSEFVEQGTLPPTWGMMEVICDKKIKLNVVVQAPPLKDPRQLDRPFVASILRNASAIVTPQAKLDEAYKEGYEQGKECLDKFSKDEIKNLESQLNNLRNAMKEFKEKSGIQINNWNAGNIGETVHILMNNKCPTNYIENQKNILEKTLNKFNEAINELKALEEKKD